MIPSLRLSQIEKFLDALTRVKSAGNFFNQYSYDVSLNSVTRNNLLLYLQQMANLKPQILLVGEAPGYRGCRLTGVPFTSEHILLNGLDSIALFGKSRGYQKIDEFEKPWKEASATVVWETLATIPHLPLIWNAFPFHPFQSDNEQSNRKPTKLEIGIGQAFLQELIQLFDIEIVVAVGNTAEVSLNSMEIPCQKVRHPSRGGKTMFINGINGVVKTLSQH
jgi:uracil-DNA glycosylase